MDEAKILYPVEWLLKKMLEMAYSLVGNWGWSILIVTLVVKLVLFPLTLKSMLSTARMGELAPKLKVLQAQYKDKPQEMQKAQMELYRKEGVNPMAGCLPILLQMPILLAMYGLFIKYFDFRGAHFIGWITDLSSPDSVFDFYPPIPLLGWTAVRLLPVIYVLSQFLMNKVTQTDQTMQNDQMKMMMNIMPIMFFFILYNMPSGLLVYWIASNLFSVVQQIFINRLKRKMKLQGPVKTDKVGRKGSKK
jgi:YidC/Oxa1 family membrane protein insertase